MVNKETNTKTLQIGLRLDINLLKDIEYLSDFEGIDKMNWIKKAIASEVRACGEDMRNKNIEDYINCRIDDTEFLRRMRFKKVPIDLKNARAEKLKILTNKEN